jgi:hypothetical protein
VLTLVIAGIALAFFEHGKRVAAASQGKPQQPKNTYSTDPERVVSVRGDIGLGLQFIDTAYKYVRNEDPGSVDSKFKDLPATPLLHSGGTRPSVAVELDGLSNGTPAVGGGNTVKEVAAGLPRATLGRFGDGRKKKGFSLHSIYELG